MHHGSVWTSELERIEIKVFPDEIESSTLAQKFDANQIDSLRTIKLMGRESFA